MNKAFITLAIFAVVFSVSPSMTFAQGASVADFFAHINEYDRYVQRDGFQPGSPLSVPNPLDPSNYVPQQVVPRSNNTSLVVTSEEDTQAAFKKSASATAGEYGEVVQYRDGQSPYQASVINARPTGIFNSGYLLIIFMAIFAVLIFLRSQKRRKEQLARRHLLLSDGFHDMNRYHPSYPQKMVR